jgi:CRISPR-associated protein Cas2
MAINKTTLNLLAYDIADPKRLTRVHRTVRGYGMPLQYSVFLVPGTAATIDALLTKLEAIIEPALDDIRVYPLPARPDAVHYGRQWLAEGVQLLGDSVFEQALTSLAQQTAKS